MRRGVIVKKEIVAMLLAGGQGSRLLDLTTSIAKPAVHFGGRYRIIDFPLSNCAHSKIDTVGVLTQYESLQLNTYIGIGSSWGLDIENGGVTILPPYASKKGNNFYTGTANAIYHNLNYLDMYNPEYVVILSGDHIYKMDYSEMLDTHKGNNADLTIAVIEVPIEEASRFGIMNTDEDMRIIEFEEKPKNPKNNLASMGIYIFSYDVLKKYLKSNEEDLLTEFDFGKNVIPAMLDDKLNLFAHTFKGYWKDVGTIQSLWEANMDLLETPEDLNLFSKHKRVLSKNRTIQPTYIDESSTIVDSVISNGCEVKGSIIKSVIGERCVVANVTVIDNSVIMPQVKIGSNVHLSHCVVKEGTSIPDNFECKGNKDDIKLVTCELMESITGVRGDCNEE